MKQRVLADLDWGIAVMFAVVSTLVVFPYSTANGFGWQLWKPVAVGGLGLLGAVICTFYGCCDPTPYTRKQANRAMGWLLLAAVGTVPLFLWINTGDSGQWFGALVLNIFYVLVGGRIIGLASRKNADKPKQQKRTRKVRSGIAALGSILGAIGRGRVVSALGLGASKQRKGPPRFIGLDVETTGLHEGAMPLEIGMIAYTDTLDEIDTFHSLVQPAATDAVEADCTGEARQMHDDNGLWKDLADVEDQELIAVDKVAREAREWLDMLTGAGQPFLLGTNPEYDRKILQQYMPTVAERFHYQSLDANAIKLLARHRHDAPLPAGAHTPAHRVLADIRGSVTLINKSTEAIVAATHAGSTQ